MGYYASFDGKGRPIQAGYAPDGKEQTQAPGAVATELTMDLVDIQGTYYSVGIKQIPPQPSALHEWDWDTHTWQLTTSSVESYKANLKKLVNEVRGEKEKLPMVFEGNAFDVDPESLERIASTARRLRLGYGLPTGWIGWRTHTNEMVWATDTPSTVLTHLDDLASEVDNRRQLIYIASWDHKDQIDAIQDPSTLLAYDITANWP